MATKIAKADADAMNSMYATEMTRMTAAAKTAGSFDSKEEGPTPSDAQAFTDHSDYLATLESVLKDDKKVDGSGANDVLVD